MSNKIVGDIKGGIEDYEGMIKELSEKDILLIIDCEGNYVEVEDDGSYEVCGNDFLSLCSEKFTEEVCLDNEYSEEEMVEYSSEFPVSNLIPLSHYEESERLQEILDSFMMYGGFALRMDIGDMLVLYIKKGIM